jgi:hypothetical protein
LNQRSQDFSPRRNTSWQVSTEANQRHGGQTWSGGAKEGLDFEIFTSNRTLEVPSMAKCFPVEASDLSDLNDSDCVSEVQHWK